VTDFDDNEAFWKEASSEIVLDASQQRAYDKIQQWLKEKSKPTLSVGGLAGSGKSVLISKLIGDNILVAAFTGKAVNVLRKKGIKNAVTLHQLLYHYKGNIGGQPIFERKESEAFHDVELIIVDEASMVSSRLAVDLLSHGIPILWVGDHGQLEPVGGGSTNYVRYPDLLLETIHRQKEGSSILDFAHHVRQGGNPFQFESTDEVKIFEEDTQDIGDEKPDIVLVGTNLRRVNLNEKMRLGEIPQAGEPLVILKNNYQYGLFNGTVVKVIDVIDITDNNYVLKIDDDTRQLEVPFWKDQFGSMELAEDRRAKHSVLADYGYAITCHKSQGSEYDHVIVYESEPKDPRWQYTAATRAARKLVYIPAGKDWSKSSTLNIRRRSSPQQKVTQPKIEVSGIELLKQRVRQRKS
jgi:exodeoxyribonuclease V